jgi:hypothetical protein
MLQHVTKLVRLYSRCFSQLPTTSIASIYPTDMLDPTHRIVQNNAHSIYSNNLRLKTAIIDCKCTSMHSGSSVSPSDIDVINDVINKLAFMRIKIGSTDIFNKAISSILLEEAKIQTYNNLDHFSPTFILWKKLYKLGIYPIQTVVKVDDTIAGIADGVAAGCWTVGINNYNLQYLKLPNKHLKIHYLADSLADVPDIAKDINIRLAAGELP